jgi:hypothetical protein
MSVFYTFTVARSVESQDERYALIRWPIGIEGTPNAADDMTPRVIGLFARREYAIEAAQTLNEVAA